MTAMDRTTARRFLVCGTLAAAINWFARMGLSQLMGFEAAVILAYAIGMIAGFWLYRTYVWPAAVVSLGRQILGFVAVNALSAVVVLAVATGLVSLSALILSPSPVIEALAHGAGIAAGAITNYLGHGAFTFARPKRPIPPA